MKIITKDNYSRDLFIEKVIAENVSKYFGQQLVDEWNKQYWTEHSDHYLALVEDDYVLYDGYAELI